MTEEDFENWLWDVFAGNEDALLDHDVYVKGNFDSFLTEDRGLILTTSMVSNFNSPFQRNGNEKNASHD